MEIAICLKCEKELRIEGSTVHEGVILDMSSGYGSRFDELDAWNFEKETSDLTRIEKAMLAQLRRAFLCDDCFEKHIDKFKLYRIESTSTVEEI